MAPVTTFPDSLLRNDLLAALSPEMQQQLFPLLEACRLLTGKVVFDRGAALSHLYFPLDVVIAEMYVLQDGTTLETVTTGREGLVGIALLMGGTTTSSRAVVQVDGSAYRIPAEALLKLQEDGSPLHGELVKLALYYTQSLVRQMSQTAVCNQRHTLDQQLCRWLLVALDRRPGDVLNMRHMLNAGMLGVQRAGVNEAADKLERAGLVKISHGHIAVVNRRKLEVMCCECYDVVKTELGRLLGSALKPRKPGA